MNWGHEQDAKLPVDQSLCRGGGNLRKNLATESVNFSAVGWVESAHSNDASACEGAWTTSRSTEAKLTLSV